MSFFSGTLIRTDVAFGQMSLSDRSRVTHSQIHVTLTNTRHTHKYTSHSQIHVTLTNTRHTHKYTSHSQIHVTLTNTRHTHKYTSHSQIHVTLNNHEKHKLEAVIDPTKFQTSASRTGLQIMTKNLRPESVPPAPAKKLLPAPAGILPPVDHWLEEGKW